MPIALMGSLTAVQFRCPAELPLNLNKIEHFLKVSSFLFQNIYCKEINHQICWQQN